MQGPAATSSSHLREKCLRAKLAKPLAQVCLKPQQSERYGEAAYSASTALMVISLQKKHLKLLNSGRPARFGTTWTRRIGCPHFEHVSLFVLTGTAALPG